MEINATKIASLADSVSTSTEEDVGCR